MFNPKRIQHFLIAGLLTIITLFVSLVISRQVSLALNPPTIHSLKPALAVPATNLTGAYKGTIAMTAPIPVGSIDFAVNLTQNQAALSGQINAARTLLYDDLPLTGNLNSSTGAFTLTAAPFTDTISGRAVQRQLTFTGYALEAGKVLSGTLTEQITGFTPQALTTQGAFVAVRAASRVPTTLQVQLGATQLNPGQQTALLATVLDQSGQPLAGVVTIFQSTLGTVSPANGVTNAQGQVSALFTAGNRTGLAGITALTESVATRKQVQIGALPTATPTASATPPPATPTATLAPTLSPTPTATPLPSPTPTVPPAADLIFEDGFETGNTSAWTASANPAGPSVSGGAALVGSTGLQINLTSNADTYLRDDRPNGEARYRVRFYFDPNTLPMAELDSFPLFYGYQGSNIVVTRIDLRRTGNQYQLRAGLISDIGVWKYTPYYPLRDEATMVEIEWQAATAVGANNGYLAFWLDSSPLARLTAIDNDTQRIDSVRLGAVTGVDTGTRGAFYLDAFTARRQSYIGFATPPVNDPIFADSFESGNLLAWPSRVTDGDLSAAANAALSGVMVMQAVVDDNTSIFVTDDSPNAERRYRAAFSFDPNTITMLPNDSYNLFYGYRGTSTAILYIELRYYNGQYQVRALTLNDGATWKTTNFTTLTDAPHRLEVEWRAATAVGTNDGTLAFWLDGVLVQLITGLDNDTRVIDRVRLGVWGIDNGTRGTIYFDAFESRRRSYIGAATAGVLAATSEEALPAPIWAETVTATVLISTTIPDQNTYAISGQSEAMNVAVELPANLLSAPALLVVEQVPATTLPEGYAQVGEQIQWQLLDSSGAPLPILAQPVQITLQSPALSTALLEGRALTLQRWNPLLDLWEIVPATINATDQTITVLVTEPMQLGVMQAVEAEPIVESEETHTFYLPLVER
jgi:hypothetical protein